MGFGRLLVRLVIGGLMMGHGLQKLVGWFGGGGPAGTGQFFEQIGLRPGKRHALAAGAAEAGGGLLLMLGLETAVAAALVQGVMLTAIRQVHWQNGPWVTNGGFEYNAVLASVLFGLVESGPGPLSLDAARGSKRHGLAWAALALGAAAAGSVAATRTAEPVVEDEATPREEGVEQEQPVETM
jgi:putative oxidoreductase